MSRRRPDDETMATGEVVEATNLSPRQIGWLELKGFITPAHNPGHPGTGHRKRWREADVRRITAVARRMAWGMTLAAAMRTCDPPVPEPPEAGPAR